MFFYLFCLLLRRYNVKDIGFDIYFFAFWEDLLEARKVYLLCSKAELNFGLFLSHIYGLLSCTLGARVVGCCFVHMKNLIVNQLTLLSHSVVESCVLPELIYRI